MAEFSLSGFAQHLAGLAVKMAVAEHEMLERAAQTIEARAKADIGHYQDDIAPFADWANLAPATVEQKTALGYAPPDNPLLRTGDMRASIEHVVIGSEAHVGSDDDIAVFQELGTERIPPRSFLGGAAVQTAPQIVSDIGAGTARILTGGAVATPVPIP